MADATLTIRRDWPRLTEADLAPFAGVLTGWLADAQGRKGAMHHTIRPMTRKQRFIGSALPVWAAARDNLAPYAALAYAKPGDVLVIATDAHDVAAVAGDILVGMARNAGVVAVVTDGIVRDLPGIEEMGIPVFAKGLSPNSPTKDGPGEIGLPVTLGGVMVGPGDLIAGDQDGVVVVPRAQLAAIAASLAETKAKEAAMDEAVRQGAKAPGWLAERLGRPDIRFVD